MNIVEFTKELVLLVKEIEAKKLNPEEIRVVLPQVGDELGEAEPRKWDANISSMNFKKVNGKLVLEIW